MKVSSVKLDNNYFTYEGGDDSLEEFVVAVGAFSLESSESDPKSSSFSSLSEPSDILSG